MTVKLWCTTANMIPAGFRRCENVAFNGDLRITINTAQSDAMDTIINHTTQGRTALTAKLQTRIFFTDIRCEPILPGCPPKLIRVDQSIGGTRTAKCLSAPRTVTASSVKNFTRHFVSNLTAKTLTCDHLSFSLVCFTQSPAGEDYRPHRTIWIETFVMPGTISS